MIARELSSKKWIVLLSWCPLSIEADLELRLQFGKKGGGGGARPRQDYAQIEKTNVKYEEYYNNPGLVPKDEQEAFWAALRRDLPNSFRFTGSRGYVIALCLLTVASYSTPQVLTNHS